LEKFRKLNEIVDEIKNHLKKNGSQKTHCGKCIDLKMYRSKTGTRRVAARR